MVEEDRFNLKPRASVLHCADVAMSVDDLAEYAQFIKGMNPAQAFHLANGQVAGYSPKTLLIGLERLLPLGLEGGRPLRSPH